MAEGDLIMDFIRASYEQKCHLLAEKYSSGHGKTLCGITIRMGITGGTSHFPSYDGCARCTRIFEKNKH
jgi:hypothetical protein